MWSWLKRRLRPAAAGRPVVAPSVALPLQQGGFVAPEALQVAVEPVAGVGMRRPLLDRSGKVAGFDLLLAPEVERRLAQRGDSPSVALHYSVLLSAAARLTATGRKALLRIPAAMLSRPKLAQAAGPGMLLLVDGLGALPAALAAELRGRGVLLGVPDGPPATAPRPDFVVLRASAGGIDTLLLSAQRWRECLPRLQQLALDLEHVEDIEAALHVGAALAGGRLGQGRGDPPPRPLGAAALRICALLNHLALDRDTTLIADEVRSDATLTYRLLRYANSPAIGIQRGVDSVDDAVQLLGRAELQRWLSVQLLAAAASRQASPALEESAVVRGRVLAAIAQARGDAQGGASFTLGVLSLIEPLLQVPMAEALAPLRLGEDICAALLRRAGPLAAWLQLLDALDSGDSTRAEALAAGLGVQADALALIVDDAWGWSSQVREEAVAA